MRLDKLLIRIICAGQLSACAGPQIVSSKLYPVGHSDNRQAATKDEEWTALRKGTLATGKARMANVGGYLVAHIEIHNTSSDAPLQILRAIAYDKEKTLLKTEHSSNISDKYEQEAARNQATASAAGINTNARMREARILQAVNSEGAWGASLGEGLASAITANIYGARAADFKNHADFINTNGYQNNPIPNGFSNRGLISFFISDRLPPYTIEIELTNREVDEKFSFTFGHFDLEAFWTLASEGREELRHYWRMLNSSDRKAGVSQAEAIMTDKEKFESLKASDPKRAAIAEWIRTDWLPYSEFRYQHY